MPRKERQVTLGGSIDDIGLIYKTVQRLPYSETRDIVLFMLATLTNDLTGIYGHTKDPE